MKRLIAYMNGTLTNPRAGMPIMFVSKTYRVYHWTAPNCSDSKWHDHSTYEGAKEEAADWEARGYHVSVVVPDDHKM